jgi:hypothetical protein
MDLTLRRLTLCGHRAQLLSAQGVNDNVSPIDALAVGAIHLQCT